MSEPQTVLVIAPPLLADLIRSVVSARFEQFGDPLSIVTESDEFAARLRDIHPDIVIIGSAVDPQAVAAVFPSGTPVLTLSPNLRMISGPGSRDSAVFTPDSLAGRLREALRALASG